MFSTHLCTLHVHDKKDIYFDHKMLMCIWKLTHGIILLLIILLYLIIVLQIPPQMCGIVFGAECGRILLLET